MKKTYVFLFMVLLFPLGLWAQDVIQSFDTQLDSTYFSIVRSPSSSDSTSNIGYPLETEVVQDGSGAIRLDYKVHNIEGYGGFVKLEHTNPDSAGFYDWSAFDTLSIWYYNDVKQDLAGRVHLRINLSDASNAPDTSTNSNNMEFYYSFHYILDNEPGWNEIKIKLEDGRGNPDLDEWGGEAFNRTGWAGIEGNDKLDTDKIRQFAFEFSINGSGEGDISQGSVILDNMTLKGYLGKSLVLFNGNSVPGAHEQFTWCESQLSVEEGAGSSEGKNGLKWIQGDGGCGGWTGAGWNLPATDLARDWMTDSLKFKMKADVGTPTIRMQIEGGAGKVGHPVDVVADDGEWHEYALALKDFAYVDGTADLDTSAITVLQFLSEGNGMAGRTIYFDDFWTGNPDIDVVAPAAPTGVSGAPNTSSYFNLVIWQDVPGEQGEFYNVYASTEPITDVDAPGVEVLATGVVEGEQSAIHRLIYPLEDTEVSYYYAVTCTDAAGNTSSVGASASATVNTAEGVATIAQAAPAGFAADGNLDEWFNSDIRPFEFSPSQSHIALGNFDDDDDYSSTAYLAIDSENLYMAFDVLDDVFSYDPAGNFWEDDVIEVYMGLYNQTVVHNGFKRGEEPDYKFVLRPDGFEHTQNSDASLYYTNDDANYEFVDFGASDFAVEVMIPLAELPTGNASDDALFEPKRGMRIPLDLVFHDSDQANVRDGILSYSPNNFDNSWQGVQNWFYTWIGDTNAVVSAIGDKEIAVVREYNLGQNYPNPFNPTTTIEYALPKAGKATITLYNVVGQKIRTLVSGNHTAGTHFVKVDGTGLSSGVYFYIIEAADFVQTRKMLLVK